MSISMLYTVTVAIWGTTWIVIGFQLGVVATEVSLVYRFALAALMLFGYCKVRKLSLKFSLAQHIRAFGIALSLFSVNYFLLYSGQHYLNSAMAAVVCSTLLIMNIINARLFFGTAISPKVYWGASLGFIGICTLFWPEVSTFSIDSRGLIGLGLCLLGTLSASFGNMLSISNQKLSHKMPIVQTNTWGMAYGTLLLTILAVSQDRVFVIDLPASYWISMLYLSLFGSVIVFGCYLSLMSQIGAHKTSYINVLTPAVAVVFSTVFENFQWTNYTIGGLTLIMLGNIIVLTKRRLKPIIGDNKLKFCSLTNSASDLNITTEFSQFTEHSGQTNPPT